VHYISWEDEKKGFCCTSKKREREGARKRKTIDHKRLYLALLGRYVKGPSHRGGRKRSCGRGKKGTGRSSRKLHILIIITEKLSYAAERTHAEDGQQEERETASPSPISKRKKRGEESSHDSILL